jgi:hypothetical protein
VLPCRGLFFRKKTTFFTNIASVWCIALPGAFFPKKTTFFEVFMEAGGRLVPPTNPIGHPIFVGIP